MMVEVYFKNDKNQMMMHWHHFVKHEGYICFDLCITISNFGVDTRCGIYLDELVQFRDDLKMMKEFKTNHVIFFPLGEFVRVDLLLQEVNSIVLTGHIRDSLFPQSRFEFSCEINRNVVQNLITASEQLLEGWV